MVKGIVRRLDELGRVTLPKEMRTEFGIEDRDKVDIYIENGVICIGTVNEKCSCCKRAEKREEEFLKINDLKLCRGCGQLVGKELDARK